MLERIQTLIEKHNPDLSGAKRYTIKPPQVVRVGSKKVRRTLLERVWRGTKGVFAGFALGQATAGLAVCASVAPLPCLRSSVVVTCCRT